MSHNRGDSLLAAFKQQVNMVVHGDPGIDSAVPFGNVLAEAIEEADFVLVVREDRFFVDSPYHDMV